MALTYSEIATITVGASGASSLDFTSIPSTFTDLCLVASLRDDRPTVLDSSSSIKFNNNTSNYFQRVLYGSGTSVGQTGSAIYPTILQNSAGATGTTFSSCRIYIPNYASSNHKSLFADSVDESNVTSGVYTWQTSGLWANTSAITQITITPDTANNYVQYSTATLYGIKKN